MAYNRSGKEGIDVKTAIGGLRVVDFGMGMSAALVAKQLAELGAHVDRIEPAAGDPFYGVYPAYRFWRRNCILGVPEIAANLLEKADICILGGEDFPGLEHAMSAEKLYREFPKMIVLRIAGYPTSDIVSRPAVDLLVQARTGIVYEQFSGRPNAAAFAMPSYGAALLGVIAILSCLVERERSGLGQIANVSLAAGGAMFWGPFWMSAERYDAGFASITPRDVRHLTLRCANDEFVQFTMAVPGALAKVHEALGIPGNVNFHDRGMPDQSRGPAGFFGDVELFDRHSRNVDRASLLKAFRAQGVPAEAVLRPGESWDDAQLQLNGIVNTDPDGWQSVGNPIRFSFAPQPAHPVPARPTLHDPAGPPLAGIRVIDCGIYVAGPYAAKLLGDYGAEVIRVEPPTGRSTLSGERTIISANHGKRAICIDAKSPGGRAVIARLCEVSDMVVSNFRPGVSKRLGLDPETLRASNGSLISLETAAYGSTGPKAQAPGFDMVIQAHCGLQYRAGGEGNLPLCTRTPIVDFAAGAVGAIALLVAAYERLKTGRALAAETSLLNVGTWMQSELLRAPTGESVGADLLDKGQTGFHPAESLYQTSDGWIAIAARSDAMAAALAAALDVKAPARRREWGEGEREQLARKIVESNTAAQLRKLASAGIWAEACVCDAWQQGAPDGLIMRVMDDRNYGKVRHCIGALIEFSRSQTSSATHLSTEPGADSAAILESLDIPAEERRRLFADAIVR